jgi:hypothetical protein
MSDCCLPNLGCLSIPVVSTNVAGTAGQNGAPGAAATIAVGTVTTVNPGDPATVTNVGTSGAAIFDFEIPEGAPGAAGVNGVSRLYSNVVPTSLAAPSVTPVTIDSYTLPANTLVNNGDAIIVTLYANKTSLNANYCDRRVTFAGFSMTIMSSINQNPYMGQTSLFNGAFYTYKLTVEFIKTSATTAISRCYADLNSTTSGLTPLYINYTSAPSFITPVFDFTQPIPILMQISQAVANGVTFQSATIDKITKI